MSECRLQVNVALDRLARKRELLEALSNLVTIDVVTSYAGSVACKGCDSILHYTAPREDTAVIAIYNRAQEEGWLVQRDAEGDVAGVICARCAYHRNEGSEG